MTTSNEPTPEAAARNFKPGDKLAGCYTLKQILPFEVPGVVWLAHDEELDKDLNLYFLPDAVVGDSRAMTEIKQEARRNRQIVHPRILRIHDLIEEDNWAAITMDHVEGETLAALRRKKQKPVFAVAEVSPWLSQICQTLEDAHKIDLLHRDLAPENILLLKSGGVMLMNFGISRAILDSLSRSGRKAQGDGNLAYTSVQQLDGERATKWDDLYALGALVYDLLTGKPPFHKGDLVSQIRKSVPAPMSERRAELGFSGEAIPKSWDKTIASCLDKHAAQRPKSASELMSRLALEKGQAAPASAPAAEATESAPASQEPKDRGGAAPAQKRGRGFSKTPVIAEATVVSQTNVEKPNPPERENDRETPRKRDGKRGATSPSGFPMGAFVEMDDSAGAPQKSKAPAVIATLAAIVAVGGLIAYFVSGDAREERDLSAGAKTSAADIHQAQNVADIPSPTPAASPAIAVVRPVATAAASPRPSPILIAQTTATPTPRPTVAPTASPTPAALTGSPLARATQAVAQKEQALVAIRQQLAAAEKEVAEKNKAQQAADAAVQELAQSAREKTIAGAQAKKAADDTAAALKQREDAQRKAEADAAEAQKAAAEKARLAVEAKKAALDAAQIVKQQSDVAQRVTAEGQELEKRSAERQRVATEAAKSASEANASRQQTAAAVQKLETELAAVQADVTRQRNSEQSRKAAEDAEKVRVAREAELKKIADQAALAAKAAADAQKALQDAQRQFDEASKRRQDAERQAEEAAKGALNVTPLPPEPPLPISSPASSASATPEAPLAMNTRTSPAPKISPPADVTAGKTVDQKLENSLGMKFAPVAGVLMSVWQTRLQDFAAFAKATGYRPTSWMQPGFKQGPDHPVVNVSWNDAMAFCKWLTDKEHKEGLLATNQSYRLPSDLEWSKAVGLPEETARTPEGRDMDVEGQYPWGTQWPPPTGAGNYTGEETGSDVAIKGYDDGFAWTSPVGSFPANRHGLYDMGGNVWQWCMDWLNDEHKAKVLRGGSWYNGALRLSLLSSCRVHASPDTFTDSYGFRAVIATEPGKAVKR